MHPRPPFLRPLPVRFFVCALVCSSSSAALAVPQRARSAEVEEFSQYAEAARSAWEIPGMAVAIWKDGEVLLEQGFGVERLGAQDAVDEHTLFSIGSTTKAMTAAVLGQLVDQGRLHFDDLVSERLPGFRLEDEEASRSVTVRDLLLHRAGLGNADLLWYGTDASRQDLIEAVALVPPAYPFRRGFVYQNVMYAVAGELAARTAGIPYEDLIENRLFAPLGMVRSVSTTTAAARAAGVARPHEFVGGVVTEIENEPLDAIAPAGAIWSSVHDLTHWLGMLLARGEWQGERVLAEETVAELLRPQVLVPLADFYPYVRSMAPHWTSYGLGWFQMDYQGLAVDFHTGSIDGMAAIVGMVPERNLGVVVLENLDHAELRHALLWRAIDVFAGTGVSRDWSAEMLAERPDPRRAAHDVAAALDALRDPSAAPSLPAVSLLGRYQHALYGDVEVREETVDGSTRLVLDAGARRRATLEHWHHDTYLARPDRVWQGASLVNFRCEGGTVRALEHLGQSFERSFEPANR